MESQTHKSMLHNATVQESLLFFALSIALFIFSLYKHYSGPAVGWEMSPYLFPILIAIFLFLLSLSLFSDGRRHYRAQLAATEEEPAPAVKADWKGVLFLIAAAVAYFILMPLISFIPATILFLVAAFLYLGERRWWMIAILSVVTSGLIYVIFGVLLHVMLP